MIIFFSAEWNCPMSSITKLYSKSFVATLLILFMFLTLSGLNNFSSVMSEPRISDPKLKVETVAQGLEYPTSMAFLGPNDILVLEKNNGQVRRVVNNTLLPEPLIDLKVANAWERGLLGIAVSNTGTNNSDKKRTSFSSIHPNENAQEYSGEGGTIYVFLYFTRAEFAERDGGDSCPKPNLCQNNSLIDGNSLANYLYRYEFRDDRLVDPKLLLKIPATPNADHNGGAIAVGDDSNVYVIIGDGDGCFAGFCHENLEESVLNSLRSNFKNGTWPDGRGGILRFTQEGNTIQADDKITEKQKGREIEGEEGILGDIHPLNKYYAYGIRNSFGLDFDPTTGSLWDTENGAGFGDEINLVEPGFNSGWAKMQGIWPVSNYTATPLWKGYFSSNITKATEKDMLVNFSGKGKYSAPEFTWNIPVAPTALKFYSSDKLGKQYENDMFVAGFLSGNIYHFDLTQNRTALRVDGALKDRIANNTKELEDVIFVRGFGYGIEGGGVTDIEEGPYDGYLYFISHLHGKLYRVTPLDSN
jgi:glucose/arabinose dehydrogenase